jgi:hypothetical protein
MNDQMMTTHGYRHVEGWDNLAQESPTRAAIFQAIVNLELDNTPPTQKAILARIRSDGLRWNGQTIPIQLSPTSTQAVSRHINHHEYGLIAQGLIINVNGEQPDRKSIGRGGPTAPWRSFLNI